MATQKETVEFLLAKLRQPKHFAARAMFGEYALYADGKVVALVCDDLLYVKILPASHELEPLCEKENRILALGRITSWRKGSFPSCKHCPGFCAPLPNPYRRRKRERVNGRPKESEGKSAAAPRGFTAGKRNLSNAARGTIFLRRVTQTMMPSGANALTREVESPPLNVHQKVPQYFLPGRSPGVARRGQPSLKGKAL